MTVLQNRWWSWPVTHLQRKAQGLRAESLLFYYFLKWQRISLKLFFWLLGVFIAVHGLSVAAGSSGYSLVVMCRLLDADPGLQGAWASVVGACGLKVAGSIVVAHGLSCPSACGIFPDPSSNLCPLHQQVYTLPLERQKNPEQNLFYFKICILGLVSFREG